MDESTHTVGTGRLNQELPLPPESRHPVGGAGQWRRFVLATGLLVIFFAVPFWQLARFAATSQFHSYILLIPFISIYLVWLKRRSLPVSSQPTPLATGIFLLAGLAVVATYWLVLRARRPAEDDYLAVMMIAFVLILAGVCGWSWGRETLRAVAFPLGLLVFMAPLPLGALRVIDAFLQHGSAVVAAGWFRLAGTPFFQDGVVFQLPNITLQIAPECSGIQSTLALLIASLLAAYLFLRTSWKRAVLVLCVIPLALLRNGFRVFVVGELCVHWGPQMINSYIHRKGGPVFFVLSLIPLFILLVVLQKSEKRGANPELKTAKTHHA